MSLSQRNSSMIFFILHQVLTIHPFHNYTVLPYYAKFPSNATLTIYSAPQFHNAHPLPYILSHPLIKQQSASHTVLTHLMLMFSYIQIAPHRCFLVTCLVVYAIPQLHGTLLTAPTSPFQNACPLTTSSVIQQLLSHCIPSTSQLHSINS